MDEGQCWMWSKRKYSESSNHASTTNYCNHDDYSWEEQAFAKDAAGSDCIWPPRSYSCSFCTREFRSAQALGGHMNVHRRDRARLKQQPHSPKIEVLETHHHHDHHPHNPVLQDSSFTTSLDYLSSLSGLAYSNSTNPNSDPSSHGFASPSNKVLAAAASVNNKINCREKALIPLYSNSSIFHESSPAPSSKSWLNLAEDYYPKVGAEKISKGLDFGCRSEKGNDDKTHHEVAVCLNLFECRAHTETEKGLKKRKTDHASISIPFFSKSNSVDRSHDHVQSQMFEFSPGSNIEELDLELRLGYRPKV